MRILITGHRGFIGTRLWNEIGKDGDVVFGIDLKEGADILECPLPEVDLVIHLAAEPGVIRSMEDPVSNTRTNVLGTVRLIQHYRDTRFIFASSGGTIQERIISPYGLSKFCCEEYIDMLCRDYLILRFPNVYGPGSRSVVDKFINEDIYIYGDGSATRTYAYIDDVVRALIDYSFGSDIGLVRLGTNQNYTVYELAKATGKPIKYLPWREGEHIYSKLENTANWMITMDAIEYIEMRMGGLKY